MTAGGGGMTADPLCKVKRLAARSARARHEFELAVVDAVEAGRSQAGRGGGRVREPPCGAGDPRETPRRTAGQ
jgi:hypothetical protein